MDDKSKRAAKKIGAEVGGKLSVKASEVFGDMLVRWQQSNPERAEKFFFSLKNPERAEKFFFSLMNLISKAVNEMELN